MKRKKLFCSMCLMLSVILLCSSCGITPLTPFTELDFGNTVGDMLEIYGETDDVSINAEEGLTNYFYPYEYKEKEGKLHFSVNSEDKIERISWEYEPTTPEEVTAYADEWEAYFTEKYGEPDFENPAGMVWYTSTANVGIFKAAIFAHNVVHIRYYSPTEENMTQ